eukprot:scaffold94260_cov82-Phaeocystis_antarctica.AAC.1
MACLAWWHAPWLRACGSTMGRCSKTWRAGPHCTYTVKCCLCRVSIAVRAVNLDHPVHTSRTTQITVLSGKVSRTLVFRSPLRLSLSHAAHHAYISPPARGSLRVSLPCSSGRTAPWCVDTGWQGAQVAGAGPTRSDATDPATLKPPPALLFADPPTISL